MGKREIREVLGGKCVSCGSKNGLHIHHKLPSWLWRYVGETDKGIVSPRFLGNYELVCNECHLKRHVFINKYLAIGFKWHCIFEIRWKAPNHRNELTYDVAINDKYWTLGTFMPSGLGFMRNAET